MQNIKVKNMTSAKGNTIPNQFIITTPKGVYFQSYNKTIAFISNDGQVILDVNNWDYSQTTGKYRNEFLKEDKKLTQFKIDNGDYKLKNLN